MVLGVRAREFLERQKDSLQVQEGGGSFNPRIGINNVCCSILSNDGKGKSVNLAVLCHCVSLTGCFTDEKGQIEVLSIRCR